MRARELQAKFLEGDIEKKLFWTLMRENYLHVLPELAEMLRDNDECKSIHITGDGVVLEKQSGIRLFFDFNQSFSRAEIDLCNAVDPEKYDMRIISELLSKKKAHIVLDIGANVGMFSLELLKDNPEAFYYAFEPIPTTYSKLLQTMELNDVDKNSHIHTLNLGMSNKKGFFKFYLPGESEAASLKPVDDVFYRKQSDEFGRYTGQSGLKEVECEVTTVDAFVVEKELQTVDFMKIDVEGNEKFVLEGATKTLEKFHPIVYCELLRKHSKRFGYHPNDVIEYMANKKYNCFTVREGEIVQIRNIDEDTTETNFIFLS